SVPRERDVWQGWPSGQPSPKANEPFQRRKTVKERTASHFTGNGCSCKRPSAAAGGRLKIANARAPQERNSLSPGRKPGVRLCKARYQDRKTHVTSLYEFDKKMSGM